MTTKPFDAVNGRYRDEVAYNIDRNIFRVRRTFLASKVEFEVEVPNSGMGKSIDEMNKLSIGERDQLVIDTAQAVLDLRSRQLSEDLDASDLGGEELVRPVGGGVFNPNNKNARRGPLGGEQVVRPVIESERREHLVRPRIEGTPPVPDRRSPDDIAAEQKAFETGTLPEADRRTERVIGK